MQDKRPKKCKFTVMDVCRVVRVLVSVEVQTGYTVEDTTASTVDFNEDTAAMVCI